MTEDQTLHDEAVEPSASEWRQTVYRPRDLREDPPTYPQKLIDHPGALNEYNSVESIRRARENTLA